MTSWKEQLGDQIPEQLASEVDLFEGQIELKKQGKLEDKIFAETRLRRGVYGQRYDNGLRDDGTGQQPLVFPCGDLKKGPDTVWDGPGMMRIKVPFGKLSAEQLELLCALAEENSDSILHVTTRQDIQLHFVHIDETPDIMRRLGAVGFTTREACGNSVRNVTGCEYAGVCCTQAFDVTPYANATMRYLLGHPDVQDFGRKFKVAFSGCEDKPCGLVTFHDLGAVAQVRDGKRGFRVVVGGGLGAVPVQAKVLAEFCPEEELLPLAQAVSRVFARLGEKQSRARARIKFLVQKLGIDEFKRLVAEERATLRPDPRWTAFLNDLHCTDEKPVRQGGPIPADAPAGFKAWAKHNLKPQLQDGYHTAIITLPLGDFTSTQGRAIAQLARELTGDSLRCTVEQNLAVRWLSGADAVAFYERLAAIHMASPGASTISDMTTCPGTDTCKLGISSSRGLTRELRNRLSMIGDELHPAVESLHMKASGCFNSCGQHHVADIGFTGVSRQVGGRKIPHFNIVLGGQWTENAKSYGLVVGAVPSKNIPKAVEAITQYYLANRQDAESFQAFVARVGKKAFRTLLAPIQKVPTYDVDPSYYSDWGDPREYTIGDIGVGECAGEIVPFVEFGLQEAEHQLHEAQDALEAGKAGAAAQGAFTAMVTAAKALVRHLEVQVKDDADDVVANFKTHLYDTERFYDPFMKGKFGEYLLTMHADQSYEKADSESAHRTLDEAQLFLEAAHACYQRLTEATASAAVAAE